MIPEQIAEWRDKAKYIWHKEPNFEGDEHPSNCFIQGYIRARTEQASEIAELVANLQTQRREYLELKTKLDEAIQDAHREARELDSVNKKLAEVPEPWNGHKFKEKYRGVWVCDCGKEIIEQLLKD